MARDNVKRDFDDAHSALQRQVAERIRELRTERGWKSYEVALRSGLTAQTYSQVEANKRKIDLNHIERIARAFGVEPAELLARSLSGFSPLALQVAEAVDTLGAKAALAVLLPHLKDAD